jgi:betaine-aldehyde dehydrogenase
VQVYDKLYIGGEWVAPSSDAVIEVVSPATEQPVGRVPEAQPADVDAAVAAARSAFDDGPWPKQPPAERAALVGKLSELVKGRQDEFARVISEEMGSPITWGNVAQAFIPTMTLDYYANLATTFPWEEQRTGAFGQPTLVLREPVGVVGAIVPWNVPLFTTVAKLAPALVAGCPVVLKPAPESPLDAFLLAELVAEAGFPPGTVNVVPAGREVGERIVTHPGVDKITFTGSTAAGKRIGALCAERLARFSLELGGKSAAVLLDDVDLDTAMPGLLGASLMNNGEACVAQTRLLVSRDRYADTVDALCTAVAAMKLGDPLDPATEVGPLVASRQRDRVEGYINLGRDEGATVALGGGRPAGHDTGFYVDPTIFTNVDNRMRIAQEEIFGPVVAVIPYDDVDDAVRIANDSDYGLSGTVWTSDVDRGIGVARRVRTGTYTVNGLLLDAATPFGGFKSSGIGREFGPEGLSLFCEMKSVNLPLGYQPANG